MTREKPMCDRNICLSNEYNGIGCDECVVNKPQESCDDAISREAVLKQLRSCLTGGEPEYQYVKLHIDSIPPVTPKNHDKMMKVAYEQGKKDFEQMPYVSKEEMQECKEIVKKYTPKRQTGEWIEHEIEDTCRWLTCSECGYEWINRKENYCPNCGAKMVKPKESEDEE